MVVLATIDAEEDSSASPVVLGWTPLDGQYPVARTHSYSVPSAVRVAANDSANSASVGWRGVLGPAAIDGR